MSVALADDRSISITNRLPNAIMEMKMKKVLAIAILVASLASPALAQSWDPDVGSGNIVPPPYGEAENGASIYQHDGAGYAARAEAPRHFAKHHHRVHARRPRL